MTTEKKDTIKEGQRVVSEGTIADQVALRIREYQEKRQIDLPANYSPENAVKAAWLAITQTVDRSGKAALTVCTPKSVAQAMLDMLLQGLNPQKKQCYFIVYGDRLTCMRSYFGTADMMMELTGCNMPRCEIIYEGDEFKYKITPKGKEVESHIQKLENIDSKKIKGAYCHISWPVVTPHGEFPPKPQKAAPAHEDILELMTFDQIRASWKHSKTYKAEDPNDWHNLQAEEACKRTILNRAGKLLINSTSDKTLLLEAFNRADEERDEADAEEAIDAGMAGSASIEAGFKELPTGGEAVGKEPEGPEPAVVQPPPPAPAAPGKPRPSFAQ